MSNMFTESNASRKGNIALLLYNHVRCSLGGTLHVPSIGLIPKSNIEQRFAMTSYGAGYFWGLLFNRNTISVYLHRKRVNMDKQRDLSFRSPFGCKDTIQPKSC